MKRLLYLAPAILLSRLVPGAGFWGPLIMLVGLIFFHEMGHFLVAKWMGMPVEVFSLGFGPRVAGFKWNETDVRVSLLPFGGYVRLAGYNPEEPEAADPHGFLSQPAWKRLTFYSGGIIANILITVIICFYIGTVQASITAVKPVSSPLQVLETTKGMPAAEAGLQMGDEIHALDDLRFPGHSTQDAIAYIQAHPGKPLQVTLDRQGKTLVIPVVPRSDAGKGKLGISFDTTRIDLVRRPFQGRDLTVGAQAAVTDSARMGWMILGSFAKLATGQVKPREVTGPIGIVRFGSRAAKAGLLQYLQVVAMISMNLAILNALPIPFLDGGHAALLLFERLRGKDLAIATKERILTGGFFFLAALMAAVMGLDLWRLKH